MCTRTHCQCAVVDTFVSVKGFLAASHFQIEHHCKEECPFRFLSCVWGCGAQVVAVEADEHKMNLYASSPWLNRRA